jgi:hypothetical protein
LDTHHNVRHLSPAETRELFSQHSADELNVHISMAHYRSIWGESPETYSSFFITLKEAGKRNFYSAPFDESLVALLAQKGIACPTYVQGRDFEVLGMPGRMLPLLAAFVLAIGAIFLIVQRRTANVLAK